MSVALDTETRPIAGAAVSRRVASLFGDGVVATEFFGAAPASMLTPGEARCATRFADKRLAEFAAGRACAHRALADLGHEDFSLLIGPDRRPQWPAGVVGSISHTSGYATAVAASERSARALGVDAEWVGRVGGDLWSRLFTPDELAALARVPEQRSARVATILFSAKEAFYKAHYQIRPQWLDFTDVTIALDDPSAPAGAFALEITSASRETFRGYYDVSENLCLTGVHIA